MYVVIGAMWPLWLLWLLRLLRLLWLLWRLGRIFLLYHFPFCCFSPTFLSELSFAVRTRTCELCVQSAVAFHARSPMHLFLSPFPSIRLSFLHAPFFPLPHVFPLRLPPVNILMGAKRQRGPRHSKRGRAARDYQRPKRK